MPRARKKAESAGDKSGPRSRPSWLPNWAGVTQAATSAGTVLIMAGLVIGLTIGRGPLQARAAELRGKMTAPMKIVFTWPAVGGAGAMDPFTRAQLEDLVLKQVTPDPFDSASLSRAQEAVMKTGWFAGPCTVRRDGDGVVRVEGRWRIPFAAVRTSAGDRWVTYRSESLDKVFPEGTSGLCVITGIKGDAPAPGEVWPGGDLPAALELLQYIRETPWFAQVSGIEIGTATTGKRQERQLAILTRYNTKVLWGGPINQFAPGEEAPAVKLRYIGEVFASSGRIDAGRACIDVRHKNGPADASPSAMPR